MRATSLLFPSFMNMWTRDRMERHWLALTVSFQKRLISRPSNILFTHAAGDPETAAACEMNAPSQSSNANRSIIYVCVY